VKIENLDTWALVDAFTVEQAACLWGGIDPSTTRFNRTQSETAQIAANAQLLSAAVQSGDLPADSSLNALAMIGDYSKSLIRADELRTFAEKKDQRPAFLFDTLLQSGSGSAAAVSAAPGPIKSKGGRPPEYNWDEFTIEIIRRAQTPDGLPDTRGELIELMLQWCQNTWGQEPSLTSVKNKIYLIYNKLGIGQKPSSL
jgi:hypothetical protein